MKQRIGQDGEIQNLQTTMSEVIRKIKAMDDRMRHLIKYVEYIAENLDTSIDYSQFYLDKISREQVDADPKQSNKKVPSFRAFSKSDSQQFFS